MESKMSSGWRFWGSWGLAFVGFPIGGLAAKALVGSVGSSVEGLLAAAATDALVDGGDERGDGGRVGGERAGARYGHGGERGVDARLTDRCGDRDRADAGAAQHHQPRADLGDGRGAGLGAWMDDESG